jgi:hypothetical protein
MSADGRSGLQDRFARGELVDATFTYASRAEIASRLVAYVSSFPNASVQDLLDGASD